LADNSDTYLPCHAQLIESNFMYSVLTTCIEYQLICIIFINYDIVLTFAHLS